MKKSLKNFVKTAFIVNPKIDVDKEFLIEKDKELMHTELLNDGFEKVKEKRNTQACQYINFNFKLGEFKGIT